MLTAAERAASLSCWTTPVDPQPLTGGITNVNFVVEHAARKYVVRIGEDIPHHGVMRFNEAAASRGAHAAGLSPAVVYSEPGALVIDFVDGKTLSEADVRERGMLERVVPLLKTCHREVPQHLRGPALAFSVFHVVRDYGHTLRDNSSRWMSELDRLLGIAGELEARVGSIDLVFGHNDLLPANLIDDGERLWLIDWDYAGFNSPLFDLGGLASNNQLDEADEIWLLENYFNAPVTDELRDRYAAMKCASLLREAMWSMVSEIFSAIEFDYASYTEENLARFEQAYQNR
ncbi:MAG: choline kinase family protein [Pseudomonadota bacterium]